MTAKARQWQRYDGLSTVPHSRRPSAAASARGVLTASYWPGTQSRLDAGLPFGAGCSSTLGAPGGGVAPERA